jgi:hypothetical protein
MKKFCFNLGVLLVVFFLFGIKIYAGVSYDLLDYIILTPGGTWMNDEYRDGVLTDEYEGNINGGFEKIGDIVALQRWYPSVKKDTKEYKFFDRDLLSFDCDYIYIHGVGETDGLYLFDPPLTIKRHMYIGESHTSQTTVTAPDENQKAISLTVFLEKTEDVVVPAGNFSDRLKIIYSITGESSETTWTAKGVGEVKYEQDNQRQELKWYFIPTDNIDKCCAGDIDKDNDVDAADLYELRPNLA